MIPLRAFTEIERKAYAILKSKGPMRGSDVGWEPKYMTDTEIEKIKTALKTGRVLWNPDSETAHQVLSVGTHAEEGDNDPCAIFSHGKYVALYNCELCDFIVATNLV